MTPLPTGLPRRHSNFVAAWAMADRLGDGRQFQLLNELDDFNREGVAH